VKKTLQTGLQVLLMLVLVFSFIACPDPNNNSGKSDTIIDNGGGSEEIPPVSGVTSITLYDASNKASTFSTIQAALNSIKDDGEYKIVLPKGTYKETFINYNGGATIKIVGDTTTKYGKDVIIEGRGSNMLAMRARELIEFRGSGNLILENVTLLSDYSRENPIIGGGQAEVLGFDSTGYLAAYNCSFLSHQDTLRTTGKAWFYNCYVEGDTDFIWMEAAGIVALYEECEIVSVFDEFATNHTSYVLAPRFNVNSVVGKGCVIYNSNLESQEGQTTYLFRNPWGTNTTSYNQGALVNVTVSGNGLHADLVYSEAMGTPDQKYVGWKVDQTLGDEYSSKKASCGVIDAELESKEYNGRRAILNRNYNITTGSFAKDMETYWDIDAFIAKQGWVVSEDSSKALLDGETEQVVTVYDLNTSEIAGLTCSGFAQEGTKAHYAGNNGSTISFDVTGPCVVTVTGYYKGAGTISCANQGIGVFECANGSTSVTISKDYVVYSEGTNTVTITATDTTYLTKIKVAYDNSITFAPVTAITVSSKDNIDTIDSKKQLQFTATLTPDSPSNADVVWSITAGNDVASIDEKGLLTAGTANADTAVTVRATSRDENAVYGEKTITVKQLVAGAFDIAWLDNADHSNVSAVGFTNGNTDVATGANGILSSAPEYGSWAHNSTKYTSVAEGGLSFVTSANVPAGYDSIYIDFPITAVQSLVIDQIKVAYGNHGTGNPKGKISYKLDGETSFTEIAADTAGNREAVNTYTVNVPVTAGKTVIIRVALGHESEGKIVAGKSPTIGTVTISGLAQ